MCVAALGMQGASPDDVVARLYRSAWLGGVKDDPQGMATLSRQVRTWPEAATMPSWHVHLVRHRREAGRPARWALWPLYLYAEG